MSCPGWGRRLSDDFEKDSRTGKNLLREVSEKMKLLFVGDVHIGSRPEKEEEEARDRILERAADADLVVFGGDISDAGRPEQYARFMRYYSPVMEKSVLIRGNHDMGDFMQTFRGWFPSDVKLNFHKGEYPVWIWTADWFEMLSANTKCLSGPQSLPAPYNRLAQPPVIVVYDGLGPYYFFEKAGFRFVILDSSTHRLGEQQRKWMEDAIGSSELPVIVMLHSHIMPAGLPYESACMLWDPAPLFQQLIRNEKVLGVFSAHLHFNSVWDWNGKKIVITASRGDSRFIHLENGKITCIEPLANIDAECTPRYDSANADEKPLDLHYWFPDGVLTKNTFWVFNSKGFFDDAMATNPLHWGWHAPDGVGGLVWSLPPEFLPDKEMWFSVNFRSTTAWKLLLEENGVKKTVCQGDPGENLIATGSFGGGPKRPFRRVILQQEAPACGHASVFMILHDTPKPVLTPYR